MPLTIIAIVVVVMSYLYFEVSRLDDAYNQPRTMTPLAYMAVGPDGLTQHHYLQQDDESLEAFGERCKLLVEQGRYAFESTVKTESWTDANGVVHIVSLQWDPAWTKQDFCDRFDQAVAHFQKLFPCP